MRHFTFFFHIKSSKSGVYLTLSAQLRLAMFQMLNRPKGKGARPQGNSPDWQKYKGLTMTNFSKDKEDSYIAGKMFYHLENNINIWKCE